MRTYAPFVLLSVLALAACVVDDVEETADSQDELRSCRRQRICDAGATDAGVTGDTGAAADSSVADAGGSAPDSSVADSGGSPADAGVPVACSGPITIQSGGTYGGCHESTNSSVAAVVIATTQAVVIDRMTIRHAGMGVRQGTNRTNVTVTNSTFTALPPTAAGAEQRAFYAYQPASVVFEHNRVVDGHGFLVNGENLLTSPFRVSFNDFVDIGRQSQPSGLIGAVHTDKVLVPGGKMLWNRVVNHHGRSVSEDVFGLTGTNGASGNPLEVAHNLVNGSYPYSGDGANFTGGAFDFADISGSYIEGHDNTAVNYTNNGFMIPSGTEVHHRSSIAVYDGIADDGARVSSTFGGGFTTWHNSSYPPSVGIGVTDCKAGHLRWSGSAWQRADFYLPVGTNSGNTSLGTVDSPAEQAAVAAFEQSVTTNGVVIGPMP